VVFSAHKRPHHGKVGILLKGTRNLLWLSSVYLRFPSPEYLKPKCYNVAQIIYDIDSIELHDRMYDHCSQGSTGREIELSKDLNAFAVGLQSFLVEDLWAIGGGGHSSHLWSLANCAFIVWAPLWSYVSLNVLWRFCHSVMTFVLCLDESVPVFPCLQDFWFFCCFNYRKSAWKFNFLFHRTPDNGIDVLSFSTIGMKYFYSTTISTIDFFQGDLYLWNQGRTLIDSNCRMLELGIKSFVMVNKKDGLSLAVLFWLLIVILTWNHVWL
jgi:hypothetical protein